MPALALSAIASNLQLGSDGLWASPTVSAISYLEGDNDVCFAVEDGSFWFAHRNQCILSAVRSFPPPGTFFDVGGGNGFVAKALQDAGIEVVLVEPGPAGARNAHRRGVSCVVRSTLQDAGFFAAPLPAVGLFDVVEHIRHDGLFLSDVHRYLVPGGRIYITVPAFRWLWSREDAVGGHQRRYTLKGLCGVLADSGFQVEFATCFFDFLIAPIFCLRALPFRLGVVPKKDNRERLRKDLQAASPAAQHMVGWFMRRELRRIAARRPVKLGGSCLVVARKPH